VINSASDEGMHKDHSSIMGKGAHNNTQLTELVVAASRYQIDMLVEDGTHNKIRYWLKMEHLQPTCVVILPSHHLQSLLVIFTIFPFLKIYVQNE